MNNLSKIALTTIFTVILSGCFMPAVEVPPNEEDLPPVEETDQQPPVDSEEAIDEPAEDGSTSADADETPKDLDVEVPSTERAAPMYVDYSESKYNELVASNKPFALFFHADWCPTCRQMEANFNETLSTFPEGTVILKTNYDTAKDLKKKYGVKTQSTVTVVGASGKKLVTLAAPDNEVLKAAIKESFES